MPTVIWDTSTNQNSSYVLGDTIQINGISVSKLSFSFVNGKLIIASPLTTLTLTNPNASLSDLAQLIFVFQDGSQFHYISDTNYQRGTAADDYFLGNNLANRVLAGDGNNIIDGQGGDDELYGGAGNDRLDGGAGNDTLIGGGGVDTLIGGDGDDNLQSGQFPISENQGDLLDGGNGNDQIYGGAGNDKLVGGTGNDTLIGTGGADTLIGGDGDDNLYSGNTYDAKNKVWLADTLGDLLDGGTGNDKLYGGAGNDILDGGAGNDTLEGGDGDDYYIIDSRGDSIYDRNGNDSVLITANFIKAPTFIEKVSYASGVQALPYWIDSLLYGQFASTTNQRMTPNIIEYAFPEASLQRTAKDIGFTPIPETHRTYIRAFFEQLGQQLGVAFQETTNLAKMEESATILFSGATLESTVGGDGGDRVRVNTSGKPISDYVVESLYAHEIGHVLGLKHPFGHPDARGNIGEGPFLPVPEDNKPWTVMSYTGSVPQSYHQYSPFDLAALQYLYGTSALGRKGDDTYKIIETGTNFIWDGNGTDTIDGAHLTQALTLYMEPGYWSHVGTKANLISSPGQITVNFSTVIENAIGGKGNDVIIGNNVGNHIQGGAGNDTLTGAGGNDTIDGGIDQDIAIYSGNLKNYSISKDNNVYALKSKQGLDGNDTLMNIESLRFADMTVSLTIQSKAATSFHVDVHRLMELYVAFFNRIPDAGGLEYWIGQFNAGQKINQIAESFYSAGLAYPELTGFASSMTNSEFINVIYKNVLGRKEGADSDGLAYWNKALTDGTNRGTLVSTILDAAHGFKGDAKWGFVADLLDNKVKVAQIFAIDLGLSYNTNEASISQGMAIAAAITPTDTSAAIKLIGISSADLVLA